MGDEATPNQQQQPAASAPPAEIDVNASVSKKGAKRIAAAVVEGIREASEPAKAKAPKRSELAEGKADKTDLAKVRDEALAEVRAVREETEKMRFEQKLLRDGGFRDDAVDRLFRMYKADKPADDAKWFADMKAAGAFVRAQPAGTQNANAPIQAPKPASPPPAPPGVDAAQWAKYQQWEASQRGASAPIAPPSGGAQLPHTVSGALDLLNTPVEQWSHLTPAQVRAEHEKTLAYANARNGAPPRPHLPPPPGSQGVNGHGR